MKVSTIRSLAAWAIVVSLALIVHCECNPSNDDGSSGGTSQVDTDNDGTPNIDDSDIDGDGIANAQDDDVDGDGIPNSQDDDIDGDGILNQNDSDVDGDGIPNGQDNDVDGDGIPNSQDDDIDGDGTPNDDDSDPSGASIPVGPDTGGGTQAGGMALSAVDTVTFTFSVTDGSVGTVVTASEEVDLDDIRQTIQDEGIELSTFSVTDFYLKAAPGSQGFVDANADSRFVLEAYYVEGGSRIKIAETPAGPPSPFPVQTVEDLGGDGLHLNSSLFGSMPGIGDFIDMIKDESTSTVDVEIDIEILDALSQTGDLDLELIIEISGKKKL
ncbi:MAG: hypothetical protein GF418_02210 [Chitinivibrionales bacterium]|nr:hypothetical protein [Chitinivibrionales bacterium]MBD3394415.1 hypothetical protein [Chitinivibrionales bacterium]